MLSGQSYEMNKSVGRVVARKEGTAGGGGYPSSTTRIRAGNLFVIVVGRHDHRTCPTVTERRNDPETIRAHSIHHWSARNVPRDMSRKGPSGVYLPPCSNDERALNLTHFCSS